MSAKKQTSLTSFFTPKPVKKLSSAPGSVEVVNSSGKKRPPVFETPLAKKATVVKMRIVEDDDSEEQENSLPSVADTTMADATPIQSMDLSVFRSNDTTPISKNNTPTTFGSSVKKSTTKAEKFKEINQKRYSWLLDIKDAEGRRETDPDYDPQTLFIPNTAWKEFTPFEKQFWEIKSQHWDKVVFFKKGKFYELYEKDATIGHQKFDLKLTDRVNMRMVGVPEMSFDYWAAQFIAKGYKVAKVEQLENSIGKAIKDKQSAKKKDDIIKRELKSILTSGTLVDSGLLSNEMSTYCMAVKQEGDKFGVAFVDTATAEFHLSHFQDDKECSLLETISMQLKPKELVLEKSNLSRNALRILKNSTPTNAQFNYLLPVKQFWDAQGTLEELKFTNYFKEAGDDSDDMQKWPIPLKKVMENKIVLSAFGGLVSYLRGLKIDRELISANNFNEYDPTKKADSLVLDGQTLLNLEIFENTFDGTDKGTLFNLINHCETPFGKRQFKRWVCHPLRSAAAIIDRQDAVEDLNGIKGVVDNLQSMFKKLPDLERLISRIHAGACKVKEFVSVLRSMESILTLSNDFEPHYQSFKSKSLVTLVTGFSQNLLPALDYFKSAFNNNEALDSDTIKPYPGFDSEYDLTEERVKELENKFEEYRKKCEKEIQHRGLVYKDLGKEIYQLEVPAKIKVPKDWTVMSKTQTVSRYYNETIRTLVKEMQEAKEMRDEALRSVKRRMFQKFDENYQNWLVMIKRVADLDCLMSLSSVSKYLGDLSCRPEIVVDGAASVLEAEELKHPCVMHCISSGDFIPNDTYLGGLRPNMILLTGPNMGGKSTLLRQTCTAVILAQLGCHVPAKSFKFTPFDRIFTRIGANDNIMAGQSTFMVELNETCKILKEATPHSLVILDELGRGTSTFDGYAIAFGVLNHLLIQSRCLGLFSTHYGALAQELEKNPLISLMHMGFFEDTEQKLITFLYKLKPGRCPRSYGMNVARLAGIPDVIVQTAEIVAKKFEDEQKTKEKKADGESITLDESSGMEQLQLILDKLQVGDLDQQDLEMVKTLWKSFQITIAQTDQTTSCDSYALGIFRAVAQFLLEMAQYITRDQVAAKKDDCWIILHGSVYNLKPFLADHPGGAKVILQQAGKDGTNAFDAIHPIDIIDRVLPKELYIGRLDPKELNLLNASNDQVESTVKKPPLGAMLNLFDFEAVAKGLLSEEAFAYYSSGADDELTLQENHSAFHRIWLRPRVLINVKSIQTSTVLLGCKSRLPIYITATALGKLGHPEGEVVLTRAAGSRGIIQMIPTLASCSLNELTGARIPGQNQWFQLYVNNDRKITQKLIYDAQNRGCKGLFITVDAPQLGRREKDMRVKFVDDAPDVQENHDLDRSQGAARAISSFIDPSLCWEDIAWFKSITHMPIVLKGIQTGEDAVLAAKSGVAGIVISNHGGRQLDTTRSGIEILEEAMVALKAEGLNKSIEVYVDGGFRRGTDIFKAISLGAKAVGIGRPFLYAMSRYGQPGVERAIDILEEELVLCMRLMGCTHLNQIGRDMVTTAGLHNHSGNPPRDSLTLGNYQALTLPKISKL